MKCLRRSGGYISSATQQWFRPVPAQMGFTIVETLIVLAVVSALFISAAVLVSGRQNQTEFNQGVRLIQGSIQQVINEVSAGYYPNNNQLKCTQTANGPDYDPGNNKQGENDDCIFLGKVIQFAVGSPDPEEYNVYSLGGLQGSLASTNTKFSEIKPRVIASNPIDTDAPDVFDNHNMPYGMTVQKMYYGNDPTDLAKRISAVGFTISTGSLGSGDNTGQVNVLALPGTTPHASKWNGVSQINNSLRLRFTAVSESAAISSGVLNPQEGVNICVNSGGTNQSALYTLGRNGSQSTVEVAIKNGADCP